MLGADAARFDPAQEMHYAISENAQAKLKSLHEGVTAIAQMFDQADPGQGGLHDTLVGALFHLVGMALEGALIEHQVVPMHQLKGAPIRREVH